MTSLGNQNTISDIDTGSPDSISDHLNGTGGFNGTSSQIMSQVTPMQIFMVVLAVIWTYMFIFAQANKETQKPVNNVAKNDQDKDGGNPGGMA